MSKHGDERDYKIQGERVSSATYSLYETGKVVHIPSFTSWIEKEKYCAKCEGWVKIVGKSLIGTTMCPTCCTPWD